MEKLLIHIISDNSAVLSTQKHVPGNVRNNKIFVIKTSSKIVKIILNINNLSNYELNKEIKKIKNILGFYENIQKINITVEENILNIDLNKILTKINDILYSYYPLTKQIKLYQHKNDKYIFNHNTNNFMQELITYKNIVMAPNKNPDTFLDYVKSRIPSNYSSNIIDINESELFPLTKSVGLGSSYKTYFAHIYPKNEKIENKNIYLIGKSVTYDSGGLNIKTSNMEEMKIDMTGGAIIVSVLNLLASEGKDLNFNIHLLLPIVENMINNTSLKPGMVVKTMGHKYVEVINIDAEGRLCIADALEYICLVLSKDKNLDNCLIIDIATLTGNTVHITSGISSLCMGNTIGYNYLQKLNNIGESIGEYIDYLKIRKEYLDMLKSNVSDIKNLDNNIKAGCVVAGTFLNFFVNDKIPWIHIDLGVSTYVDSAPLSYGVNLLYEFIHTL
jgi:leucyl aminopeptidase